DFLDCYLPFLLPFLLLCACVISSVLRCSLFFFQAEDGIRHRNVTGVQTCALPISVRLQAGLRLLHSPAALSAGAGQATAAASREIGRASCRERGTVTGGAGAVKKK